MKPIRAAAVVIKNKKVLLIHRLKKDKEYYVFPGGMVEKGEEPTKAALRELFEETTIRAEIKELLYKAEAYGQLQYYYLCKYISGEPSLHQDSPEFARHSHVDFYEPIWIDLKSIGALTLYPEELKKILKNYG